MSGFGRKGLADEPTRKLPRASALGAGTFFDVTPSPWQMLLAAFACLAGILIFLLLALEGRGLILFIIPLGPTGAQIFYILMMMVCLFGLAHAFRGFLHGLRGKVWVTLDHQAIVGPTQYSGTKTNRITFNGIENIDLSNVGVNEFLVIKARDGRKIKVGSANFRDSGKWPLFLEELDRRLNDEMHT